MGITIIMAQAGFYVPCTQMQYRPYHAIFSRITKNDDLFRNLSTFALEMSEMKTILQSATKNTLVFADEIANSTEIQSGLSIVTALLMNLHEKQTSFVISTHFNQLNDFEEIHNLPRLKMMHMTVVYDRALDALVYERIVRPGIGNNSYGLEVATSLHFPETFMEKAFALRNKYFPEYQGSLSDSVSRYNAKKVRGKCEMCKEEIGEEMHHLREQREADSKGFIEGFHKNHPANLVSLCIKCHDKCHDPDPLKKKRVIKKTTHGYQLVNGVSTEDGEKRSTRGNVVVRLRSNLVGTN
jgi:DNA mismatch repair protein MutS